MFTMASKFSRINAQFMPRQCNEVRDTLTHALEL